MLIYDISRELLSATVYEGDPRPKVSWLKKTSDGAMYNLSTVSLCSHTGTHIDAPFHFDEEGNDVSAMRLSQFYGKCTVVTIEGILTGESPSEAYLWATISHFFGK